MDIVRAALLVFAVTSCGDSTGPVQGIAGDYRATELRLTLDGRDADLLAEGAQLSITLAATGSGHGITTGSLVLPEGYTESGSRQTASLDGTYRYDAAAGTVSFDHDSDSFLPYMTWSITRTGMSASFSAGENRLKVTLEREG